MWNRKVVLQRYKQQEKSEGKSLHVVKARENPAEVLVPSLCGEAAWGPKGIPVLCKRARKNNNKSDRASSNSMIVWTADIYIYGAISRWKLLR